MPPKSIFRQPGAKHFQLVHRSQRDPLIHDADASPHVLKEIPRAKKGKSRAELESEIAASELDEAVDTQAGQAALYGIYYDDTEYDYMQHLRNTGVEEEGVETILIEAPTKSKHRRNAQATGITLKDLPPDVLPSTYELPRTYDSQQDIPESISGLRPDMDPHLRQTLEALEDDAFVDDGLEDDFFDQLLGEGERDSDEDFGYEFQEQGIPDGFVEEEALLSDDAPWEQRFAQFKRQQMHRPAAATDDGEEVDTISGLPPMSVIGGKGRKRRKGTSNLGSEYSISSSTMFRNDALQTLDERFDQVMQKVYNSDGEDEDDDNLSMPDDDEDETPNLITSRDDFNSMMTEFLDEFEILGKKMQPKLAGETGAEKLDTLRRAMGQDERNRITTSDNEDEEGDILTEIGDNPKDRWDCETILTTYSNLENHPRLIRARDITSKATPKIILDPKTGLPSILPVTKPTPKERSSHQVSFGPESDETDESDTGSSTRRAAIGRPRNESPESKKARKTAIKASRAARRVDKKATKEKFGNEYVSQGRVIADKERQRSVKKL